MWKGAGLKSGNCLNNPRHSIIVALFVRHNADVAERLKSGPVAVSERKAAKETARARREKIADLTKQRDMAASQNTIFEREALYYKQQYEDLLVLTRRLEADHNEWREKFFKTQPPRRA